MYQCTTCLKEFTTERSYAGHRSSHNRFNPSYLVNRKKEVNPIMDIVQPKKECNYCGKQFINGWQLGGHKVSCERKHRRELLMSSVNSTQIQVNKVIVNTT